MPKVPASGIPGPGRGVQGLGRRLALHPAATTTFGQGLAAKLIAATCAKQGIPRGQLSLHTDRGSSMTSKPVALLLAGLGVTQSHSRPHVSNDNPYSEAQFKTLKYRPGFPARFPSIEAAARTARSSSPGTATSTATAGSAFIPPPASTTATPQPSRPSAPRSWTPPASPTLSVSSAGHPPRQTCRAHPGSTGPRRRKPPLSKRHSAAPRQVDRFRGQPGPSPLVALNGPFHPSVTTRNN